MVAYRDFSSRIVCRGADFESNERVFPGAEGPCDQKN